MYETISRPKTSTIFAVLIIPSQWWDIILCSISFLRAPTKFPTNLEKAKKFDESQKGKSICQEMVPKYLWQMAFYCANISDNSKSLTQKMVAFKEGHNLATNTSGCFQKAPALK